MIPSNLKECFEVLDIWFSADDQKIILEAETEDIMYDLHHGLGRKIRNDWGLWKEDSNLFRYFKSLGIWHPDDMSGIILVSYWRLKHNQPINLDQQIKYYQDFWEKEKISGPIV